jgi:hypothetical protein
LAGDIATPQQPKATMSDAIHNEWVDGMVFILRVFPFDCCCYFMLLSNIRDVVRRAVKDTVLLIARTLNAYL